MKRAVRTGQHVEIALLLIAFTTPLIPKQPLNFTATTFSYLCVLTCQSNAVSADDYGRDLAGVQALQRKQEEVERDMTALHQQLQVCGPFTVILTGVKSDET